LRQPKLEQAKEIIASSQHHFLAVHADLADIKVSLPKQLTTFATTVINQNDDLRGIVRKYGEFLNSSADKDLAFRGLRKEASRATKTEPIKFLLLVICGLEIVCFAIFLSVSRIRRPKKQD
jgi:hypothetical protein